MLDAQNANSAFLFHQAAFYAWEATLRLASSVVVAEHVRRRCAPDPKSSQIFSRLTAPLISVWCDSITMLVPELVQRGDEGFASLSRVVLENKQENLPDCRSLAAALNGVLIGKHHELAKVHVAQQLFPLLVQYRKSEVGHGALTSRSDEHYQRLGKLFVAALIELRQACDLLGGRTLVFVRNVSHEDDGWKIDALELHGAYPSRTVIHLPAAALSAELPLPNQVHVVSGRGLDSMPAAAAGEQQTLCSLHPLVLFDERLGCCCFHNQSRESTFEYLAYERGERLSRDVVASDDPLTKYLTGAVTPKADASRSQNCLGGFAIEAKIGQGAMFSAYRAWQSSPGRHVALKCLRKPTSVADESRFFREVEVLGKIKHPNLVPAYTSGCDNDRCYLAVEYVPGPTLAEVLDILFHRPVASDRLDRSAWQEAIERASQGSSSREKELSYDDELVGAATEAFHPVEQAGFKDARPDAADELGFRAYLDRVVELMHMLAEAIGQLHLYSVVHGRLDPGQIVVTNYGRRPVLVSAGEAIGRQDVKPGTFALPGRDTLRYASPEVIRDDGSVDLPSDVYQLGAIFWELLARAPLFGITAETPRAEAIRAIQFEMPRPLRKLDRRIPVALETIVQKCLAKQPHHRYPFGADLAYDLRSRQRGALSRPHSFWPAVTQAPRRLFTFATTAMTARTAAPLEPTSEHALLHNLYELEVARIERLIRRTPADETRISRQQRTELRTVSETQSSEPDGCEILETLHLCDLRHWQPVPPDQRGQLCSPAIITVQERLQKLEDTTRLRRQFCNRGLRTFVHGRLDEIRGDELSCSLLESGEQVVNEIPDGRRRPLLVDADVSNIPVATPFGIQWTMTCWNDFQNTDELYTDLIIPANVDEATMLVLLPAGYAHTSYQLQTFEPAGSDVQPCPGDPIVFSDAKGSWICWRIQSPVAHRGYRVRWTWEQQVRER